MILEPDGLGIIRGTPPSTATSSGVSPPGRRLAGAARFTELNAAVDRIKEQPNAAVYLDGTHSAWLGVGDLSDRLIKAGVERADGFFLNVSNYQEQRKLEKYGTWTSLCLYLAEQRDWWNVAWCGSQYFPANPADFDTWVLTDQQYVQQYADAGLAFPTAAESDALRGRHQPERPGAVDPAGRPPAGRPAGLVQPAGSRPRPAPDERHVQPDHRRLPVGQDPRRVRRRVHPAGRPAAASTRSAGTRTRPPASGSPRWRSKARLAQPPLE